MPRYGSAGISAAGASTAATGWSVLVIRHLRSAYERVEMWHETPDVLHDELDRALLVLPGVQNERVGLEIDRVHIRPVGRVDPPPQCLEEHAEVVVEEAVPDEQRRPLREIGLELQRDRVVRLLVAHAEQEPDVVVLGDDHRLLLVDIAVDLEDDRALDRRIRKVPRRLELRR